MIKKMKLHLQRRQPRQCRCWRWLQLPFGNVEDPVVDGAVESEHAAEAAGQRQAAGQAIAAAPGSLATTGHAGPLVEEVGDHHPQSQRFCHRAPEARLHNHP